MFKRNWAAAIAAALIAASVMAPAALARNRGGDRGRRAADRGGSAVFVQTDESSGNRIVVFDRGTNGRLTRAASYLTGGNGGTAQPGNQSDHLASQGSLAYDPVHKLLIAVN